MDTLKLLVILEDYFNGKSDSFYDAEYFMGQQIKTILDNYEIKCPECGDILYIVDRHPNKVEFMCNSNKCFMSNGRTTPTFQYDLAQNNLFKKV